MSRLDHEESPAWGKGIDYFELAKSLTRQSYEEAKTSYTLDTVLRYICNTWVDRDNSDIIFGHAVCLSCFQTIQGDLDANPEVIE